MVRLDVLIVGGGIAGVWTLDELVRRGLTCALIERTALGDGQTMWSQGIIHSGLKYTLGGALTGSAAAIREAPDLWKACLRGEREPDLSGARVRSDHCWLWRTRSLKGRVGMIGARAGLRVAPEDVPASERPGFLRDAPAVARVAEPVVDVASVLEVFRTRHAGRLVRGEVAIEPVADGALARVAGAEMRAGTVVLCAGNGNAALMELVGIDADERMQVRDLHMVLARGGSLPELHGHCVDLNKTRITVTSVLDAEGRVVWQIGGEVAEKGVGMERDALIEFARNEVAACLPGLDLSGVEWATYRAPRAEGRTRGGGRPEGAVVRREGAVVVAWPTKLALAPMLAGEVARVVEEARPVATGGRGGQEQVIEGVERPGVARGAWENAAWSSA
jgi:glycine/D-amino acid oxidase-like deaminating enzyme